MCLHCLLDTVIVDCGVVMRAELWCLCRQGQCGNYTYPRIIPAHGSLLNENVWEGWHTMKCKDVAFMSYPAGGAKTGCGDTRQRLVRDLFIVNTIQKQTIFWFPCRPSGVRVGGGGGNRPPTLSYTKKGQRLPNPKFCDCGEVSDQHLEEFDCLVVVNIKNLTFCRLKLWISLTFCQSGMQGV